jgi:hypothetical protein
MNAEDETNITEIEILPDGRIYVFGTSLEVLAVLDVLQSGADETVKRRLDSLERLSIARKSRAPIATGETHV